VTDRGIYNFVATTETEKTPTQRLLATLSMQAGKLHFFLQLETLVQSPVVMKWEVKACIVADAPVCCNFWSRFPQPFSKYKKYMHQNGWIFHDIFKTQSLYFFCR
jgi:hypothetical protein